MSSGSVLLVDPNAESRETIAAELRAEEFDVRSVPSADQARQALDNSVFDCLVTEYELPEGDGLELVQAVREQTPDTACVIFTATPLDAIDTEAVEGVIAEFLSRDDPDALESLISIVKRNADQRSQTAYPQPDGEMDRLIAVEQFAGDLNSARDCLHLLTRTAATVLDLPMGVIGVMDDREQRFPVCFGASFDPLPREDTICTWAMLDEEVTVIEDVLADPRFRENEALEERDIRFYASANLTTNDGSAIGTLCVYGTEPRAFDSNERELLALFADLAIEVLELCRANQIAGGDNR